MTGHRRPSGNDLVRAVFLEAWRAGFRHLWVSQAIALAEPLGLDERAVRTSLARLEHQGLLSALRLGRQSRYGLTPAALAADARRGAPPWDGCWTVAAPVLRQPKLAAQLHGLGYRQIVPGLYGRPGGDTAAVAALVRTHAPGARTLVFESSHIAGLDQSELAQLVSAAWDLPAIAALYEAVMARCEPVPAMLAEADPRQGFALRARLLHDWRRACAADVRLPSALLPPAWPAGRARHLYQHIDGALRASATGFVASIVGKPCDNTCLPVMRQSPGNASCPAE